MLSIERLKDNKLFLFLGVALVIIIAAIIAIIWCVLQPTSPKRLTNKYNNQVESYISPVDRDNDGIDDQTDILEGAVAYINTCPKYKN